MLYRTLTAPVSVQIELTTACDNDCIHCYNHWRHDKKYPGVNMSEKVLLKAIDDLINARIFHVTFTGGEPFLRRKLLYKGLSILRDAGIVCDINTNLTLFTPNDAEVLLSMGIMGVLTSVASHNHKTHDYIMQRDGAFDLTLSGIQTALNAGVSVAVSMVVTTINAGDVYETGRYLHKLGVSQFFATKASQPINAQGFEKYLLSQKELSDVLESLSRLRKDTGMSVGVLECYPLCAYLQQEKYDFLADRRCSAGITTCSIGSNGSIRACSHSDTEYGNILTEGLVNSWRSMNEWRDGTLLPKICTSCDYLSACSGGCRVDAECVNGNKCGLDPYAIPEDTSKIHIANIEASLPVVNLETLMRVSDGLIFRDDDFCVLCATVKNVVSPVTLSRDSYELLLSVKDNVFTLNDIICYTELSQDDAQKICGSFLRDGIFESL